LHKHWFLIWKNLRRNARRSILTILSNSISVFLLGSLFSVYGWLYNTEVGAESALRLLTRHKVSVTQALPYPYRARIAAIDGVDSLVAMNWFAGFYIDRQAENMFPHFAVEPDELFDVFPEYDVPPEQLKAFKRDRQGMAIGKSVADRLGLELGQRITLQGIFSDFDPEINIRAIFEGPDDFNAFFHIKYLEEGLGPERGSDVSLFVIRLRSIEDASSVSQAVDEMFRNTPAPTKTEAEAAFAQAFVKQIGNVKLFLLSIGTAIVFTMLMVSANTIAMSVRERTREIGVLKTLGFPSTSVLALVLGEATLISVLGGVVGVALTLGVTTVIAGAMDQFVPGFTLPIWGVLPCFAIVLAVGLTSSAVPAAVAARKPIVDALRHTG